MNEAEVEEQIAKLEKQSKKQQKQIDKLNDQMESLAASLVILREWVDDADSVLEQHGIF
jgi:uncharacterized coiled-coil protein SlyX